MEHVKIEDRNMDVYFRVGLIMAKDATSGWLVHYKCESVCITEEVVEAMKQKRVTALTYAELPEGMEDTWVLAYVCGDGDKIQIIHLKLVPGPMPE